MTTPARSFQLAKPRTTADRDAEYDPIPYELAEEDGTARTIVAHYPGEGVFSVLLAQTGMSQLDEQAIAGSLFTALSKMFVDGDDYNFLKGKIENEELAADQLMELIEDMIQVWAAFPTKRSSASTRSQRRTGGRSTGRVPATAPTQAASPTNDPTDSAA